MGEKRLPELLKQMRAAITRGDLTKCLETHELIESEWDAIKERLCKLDWECEAISMALAKFRREMM